MGVVVGLCLLLLIIVVVTVIICVKKRQAAKALDCEAGTEEGNGSDKGENPLSRDVGACDETPTTKVDVVDIDDM